MVRGGVKPVRRSGCVCVVGVHGDGDGRLEGEETRHKLRRRIRQNFVSGPVYHGPLFCWSRRNPDARQVCPVWRYINKDLADNNLP